MTKLLLLTPPMGMGEMFARGSEATASFLPPLGLAYIAAYIRQFGYEPKIIDGAVEPKNFAELSELADSFDIVGISVVTAYYLRAKELILYLRAAFPNKLILAGGPHATARPQDLLDAGVDIVVLGEGEETTKDILDLYSGKTSTELADIPGIAFKDSNSNICKTSRRKLIANLDDIPMPALDLLPMHKYGTSIARTSASPSLSIMTGRGCTGICSFCNHQMFGKMVRRFSADRVVEEFFTLRDVYGANSIAVWDDNFVEDSEYVREVCEKLIEKGFDKPFSVESRVDAANAETLALLKKAGCDYVAYGFECGSQRVLDYVKKKQTIQQMREAVRLTKKAGLKIRGYFMLGFPTETKEEMAATIQLAKEFDVDVASFTLLTPLPGALDYTRAQKSGDFDPLFFEKEILAEFNFPLRPIYVPDTMDAATLLRIHKNAYTQYYFSPKIILRRLLSVRTLGDVRSIMKAGKTLIKNFLFRT